MTDEGHGTSACEPRRRTDGKALHANELQRDQRGQVKGAAQHGRRLARPQRQRAQPRQRRERGRQRPAARAVGASGAPGVATGGLLHALQQALCL